MSTGHTSKESKAGIDVDTGHALARKAAAQCVVLLKNDGDVLPLDRDASIAVVGELARTPRLQGGGSSRVVPTKVDIPLDEMEKLAGRSLPFAPGYRVDDGDGDAVDGALVAEAKAVAASSRVTVVFVGLPDAMESEGFDREHLELPAGQLAVLEGVVSTGARVVVVLFNGGVVRVSGWAAKVPAVLEAWLLGQAGGGAIADLVFGVENPCGRLAETIPVRLEDNPSFHNFPGELGEVHYGERVFVGYRHYDSVGLEVCFPFGHGLSYTAFDYSDLEVVGSGADEDLTVSVRLQVTNKGERDGREVVQLYIRPGRSVVRRPPRELRRFAKVSLPAGESTVVGFDLGWRDFAYYDVRQAAWSVEPGDVAIEVGASSRDIRLVEHVELRTGETPEPLTLDSPLVDWVRSEKGRAALETALRSAPAPRWPRSRIFGEESLKGGLGFVPLRRLARFPGAGLDPDVLESFVKRWEDGDEGAGA